MTTWPVVWHAFSDAIRTYYLDMTDRDPQHVTVGDVRLFLTHRASSVR